MAIGFELPAAKSEVALNCTHAVGARDSPTERNGLLWY